MTTVSHRPLGWPRLMGPLMTGLLIIAVEAARALGIHVHGLGAVLLVTVSFAVLSGGAVVGVVSGAIGLAYIAYYHAEPGTRLTYSADNVQRLVTDLVTAVIVLAVGLALYGLGVPLVQAFFLTKLLILLPFP